MMPQCPSATLAVMPHTPSPRPVPWPQALLCAALFVFAFVAAPHSCAWGLDAYAGAGLAVVVALALLAFIGHGRSARRAALHVALGIGIWLLGFWLADVRLMCRLF